MSQNSNFKAHPSFIECLALKEAGFLNAFNTRVGGLTLEINSKGWPVVTAHQTHSDVRLHVTPMAPISPSTEGDALFTSESHVLVGVRTADCLPVLIADPKTRAVAVVHAGWRGTKSRIVEKTVADLRAQFGVDPSDCLAALGPGACGDCYEVGPEVVSVFDATFIKKIDGKTYLNVAAANRAQLEAAGLSPSNIFMAPHCTMHQNELFFSHRRESTLTPSVGRQISVIGRS